jgi:integrase
MTNLNAPPNSGHQRDTRSAPKSAPKSIKLDSKTARLKLPVRKKSYTARIAPGIRLAYRRNEGAGTWSVIGGGGQWLKKIGIADDLERANGVTVLDYWQATERARDLARAKGDADGGKPITVAEALEAYAADLTARDSNPYNATRVLVHLPPALLSKTVAILTARELRRWRDGLLTKGLARGTVRRTTKMLKAALTQVADQDPRIANRDAWRVGLAGLPDAENVNNVILPDASVRSIVTAATAEGPEFEVLVELAAITGARVSQLFRLEVGDVQAGRADPRLMMPTSAKGRGRKVIGRRPVPISAAFALRLRQLGAGRPARARLLLRSDGEPWGRSDHLRPFARTVARAGLDPDEVTIYALRHSSIVRALLGGVPARIVAVNHDTSVVQLEHTYSKNIADHSDAVARQALLDLEQPVASNVRPLR